MADQDPAGWGFVPQDPVFIADPYPAFARMRAAGRVLYYPPRDLHLLTRFADVNAALRDRRLGRAYQHRYTPAEFGRPDPDYAVAAVRRVRTLVAAQPGTAGSHEAAPTGHQGVHRTIDRGAAPGDRVGSARHGWTPACRPAAST